MRQKLSWGSFFHSIMLFRTVCKPSHSAYFYSIILIVEISCQADVSSAISHETELLCMYKFICVYVACDEENNVWEIIICCKTSSLLSFFPSHIYLFFVVCLHYLPSMIASSISSFHFIKSKFSIWDLNAGKKEEHIKKRFFS